MPAKEILKCIQCGNFQLSKTCIKCSGTCITPKPAKYSLEDKYQKYRIQYKEQHNL